MTYLTVLLFSGVIVYAGVCGFLYVKQRDLLYFPSPNVELTDNKYLLLQHAAQSLKIWVLNEGKPRAILYFGGNAEAVEENISSFEKNFANYTIYLPNYRGFGGSSGEANEKALYEDALFIYDEIKSHHLSVSLLGRSLGSGVATYVATNRVVDRLALVTPYDSIVNVAKFAYPWFPVSLLLQDRYESVKRASKIRSKTLLVIAEHDEIIPRERSDALAAVFEPGLLSKTVIADHDHNSLILDPDYDRALKEFFK